MPGAEERLRTVLHVLAQLLLDLLAAKLLCLLVLPAFLLDGAPVLVNMILRFSIIHEFAAAGFAAPDALVAALSVVGLDDGVGRVAEPSAS